MLRRKNFTTSISLFSALAFLSVLTVVASAQQDPKATGDMPFRRTVISLEKNPSGQPAIRNLSDAKGHFTFPTVGEGSYTLMVGSKVGPTTVPKFKVLGAGTDSGANGSAPPMLRYVELSLRLPGGKQARIGFDIVRSKAFDPAGPPTSKATKFYDYVITVPAGGAAVDGMIFRSKWNPVK